MEEENVERELGSNNWEEIKRIAKEAVENNDKKWMQTRCYSRKI